METQNREKLSPRLAVNGLGRIGRVAIRALFLENYDLTLVAINTSGSMDAASWLHLLKYDTVYGRFPARLELGEPQKSGEIGRIIINGRPVPILAQRDPAHIPWKNYRVDVLLECTGAFAGKKAEAHLGSGAKKVIISAPVKDKDIPIIILGVNERAYKGERLVSNGSCTTNSVAPIIKVIDEKIGFQEAVLTTIHAYTGNQNMVDGSHKKDLRRARSGPQNIVPTSTGAAKAVMRAYPDVKGRFSATAIRVPVVCGSYSDLTFKLIRRTTIEAVTNILEDAAFDPRLVGRLKISYEPLVSSDIIGNSASCLVDTMMTRVLSDDLLKIGVWYDNEYGYSCRLLELAQYIHNYPD